MPIDLEELVDLFYSLSFTRTLPDDLFKVLWGFWEKGWWCGMAQVFLHATESCVLVHLIPEKQMWLRAAYLGNLVIGLGPKEKGQYLNPRWKQDTISSLLLLGILTHT